MGSRQRLFDMLLIDEGETSPTATISNLAVIDNVVCQDIFGDGFEFGDFSAWSGGTP